MASLQNKIVDYLSKTHAGKEEFRLFGRNGRRPLFSRGNQSGTETQSRNVATTGATTDATTGATSDADADAAAAAADREAERIEKAVLDLKNMAITNKNSADDLNQAADTLDNKVSEQVENVHKAKNDNDFSSILIGSIALEELYGELVTNSNAFLKLHEKQQQIKNQATTLQQEILKITITTDIITRCKASVASDILLIDGHTENISLNYNKIILYKQNAEVEARNAEVLKSSAPFLVAAPMAIDNNIQKQNDEIDATFSTKYTQILYQEERNKTAKLAVYWVNIVYYILGCIVVYFLIFSEKTAKTKWQYKLLYTVLIAVFPFIIVTIELYIKQVLEILYVTILGKPYEPSKWKIMGEPEFNKKPPGYGIPEEGPQAPA